MLDPTIGVAVVSALASIIAAVLAYLAARRSTAQSEVAALRSEIADVRRQWADEQDANRRLWAYCRKLVDHIYKGLGPPPPPPDDLEDLFPKE